jgi:uncharacterized protein
MKNSLKFIFAFIILANQYGFCQIKKNKADEKANTNQKTKVADKDKKPFKPSRAIADSATAANKVIIKIKNYGDSVVLRWQPSNELYWRIANQVGYQVDRYTITKDTTAWVKKSFTLKPWTIEEVKQKTPKDTIAGTMATLAFGGIKGKPESVSIGDLLSLKYENENRFFLAMLMASYYPRQSEKMALRMTDKTIEKGKNYLYRIYANTGLKKLPSDTALVYLDTKTIDQIPLLPTPLTDQNDKAVVIKLNRKYCENRFVGYYFERADNGSNFKRLNAKPFVQVFSGLPKELSEYISYTDSVKLNYKKYQYRVIGITNFGDLSKPSATLTLNGVDQKAPAAVSDIKAVNSQGSEVNLTWQNKSPEADLAGYLIGKSTELEGPFLPLNEQLLPKTTMTFTDRTAVPSATNYYVVSAVDTAGNSSISVPVYVIMKDENGPAKPSGLKGTIDSTGNVQITWAKNTEPDLMGYMVYTANAPDHEFTPITSGFLEDEFFTEKTTLRTLTENKYFKVVAFDKSRHASLYSDMLTVKRPDKVPPTTPVFNNFSVTDSLANIFWLQSTSEDVVYQNMYRKEEGKDKDWVFLKKLEKTETSYTDKTVKPEKWYAYSIEAVDDANLKSEKSFPIRVRPYDSGIRPAVSKVNVIEIQSPRANKISWSLPSNTSNCRILIYKKISNTDSVVIENLAGTAKEYTDTNLGKQETKYGIQLKYPKGASVVVWSN